MKSLKNGAKNQNIRNILYLGDSKGRKGVMKCSNPRGPRPPKTLRNLWPLVKYTTSSVMTFLLASLGVVPDSTLLSPITTKKPVKRKDPMPKSIRPT